MSLDALVRHAACRGRVHLAWWESPGAVPSVDTPEELASRAEVTVVEHVSGGTLYSIEPPENAPATAC